MVGQVTAARYEQLVAQGRELVELASRCQWKLGDFALEVEPLRPVGGAHPGVGEEIGSVDESLARFADDLALAPSTVKKYRYAAARWPAGHRAKGVSHNVHLILSSIEDEQRRWALIADPPVDPRTGARRWTTDLAKRAVGQRVNTPVTVVEKVNAIHELVRDEKVAVQVATDLLARPEVTKQVTRANKVNVISTLAQDDKVAANVAADLLRRPKVAAQVVADDTARAAVNRAQVERVNDAGAAVRRQMPQVARATERIAHSIGFVELVGSCHAFTSNIGRIVPGLRGRSFTDSEQAVLSSNIAKVRASADWIETAVDTGNVDLAEGLAALLRGE